MKRSAILKARHQGGGTSFQAKFIVPTKRSASDMVSGETQIDEKENNYPVKNNNMILQVKPSSSSLVNPIRKGFVPPSVKSGQTGPNTPTSRSGLTSRGPTDCTDADTKYYVVLYTKRSNKKHKSYQDGILTIFNKKKVCLKDTEGKTVAQGNYNNLTMVIGSTLEVGQKELEIVSEASEEDYNSGKLFRMFSCSATTAIPKPSIPTAKKFKSHKVEGNSSNKGGAQPVPKSLISRDSEGAHLLQEGGVDINGKPTCDVVCDPVIGRHLRPHQVEGVKFLYNCLNDMSSGKQGRGAILADEMGLGKTVQTIATLWTLLKQGPYGKPLIKKAMVVCPSSLCKNWMAEVKKWLGTERLDPILADTGEGGVDSRIQDYKCGRWPLLIISYDMFRKHQKAVANVCDLIVCDEGHRLKNKETKLYGALKSVTTRKRLLLSGTPVQNDMDEFFAMCDFVNPGFLGDCPTFRRVYAEPIDSANSKDASSDERRLANARSKALSELTATFILRRTNEINEKYLPPKKEIVLFCAMSDLQCRLYKHFLRSKVVTSLMYTSGKTATSCVFECVTNLKKLCNHPELIHMKCTEHGNGSCLSDDDDKALSTDSWAGALDHFPEHYTPGKAQPQYSGKMQCLDELLAHVKSTTSDRVVVVSNYTQTLDLLQRLCNDRGYDTLRLDGQTEATKRQQLVNQFNAKWSKVYVFLLSSKAGGIGLNLIGANRLVLYDPDWNPANDLQAMARVWRDGQKKDVTIYRLMCTGTLEEKIYQRQMTKRGLSLKVVDDAKKGKAQFSKDDLKNLFQLVDTESSDTLDMLRVDQKSDDGKVPGWIDKRSMHSSDVVVESALINMFEKGLVTAACVQTTTEPTRSVEDDLLEDWTSEEDNEAKNNGSDSEDFV